MRYKLLGKSGLRVSELALGAMTFGEERGWGAGRDESKAVFDLFTEEGGNFIDTACNYAGGNSERLIGEFVASDRSYYVLGTKYTSSMRLTDPNAGGNHRKNLIQSVEGSLRRLNTDYIDLLWVHAWDSTTPVDEVMRGLDDLVRSGKVLYIGISDTPAWIVTHANVLAELRGWSQFVALQVPYCLANRDVERELLPMARAFDMSVTTWGSIGGGVLTGKYRRDEQGPSRYNRNAPRPGALDLGDVVANLADELGRPSAAVALNWVRQRSRAMIPLVGARTAAQMKENLECLDFELTPAQMDSLTAAAKFEPGFPHTFLANSRQLVFGQLDVQIDTPRG